MSPKIACIWGSDYSHFIGHVQCVGIAVLFFPSYFSIRLLLLGNYSTFLSLLRQRFLFLKNEVMVLDSFCLCTLKIHDGNTQFVKCEHKQTS